MFSKKNVSSHSFSKNKQVSPQPCHSWPKLLMPSTQLAAPSNTTQLPSHVGKTSKNLPVLLGTVLSKVCWKMNQHKIYLNGKRKKEVTTNTRSELTCLKSWKIAWFPFRIGKGCGPLTTYSCPIIPMKKRTTASHKTSRTVVQLDKPCF